MRKTLLAAAAALPFACAPMALAQSPAYTSPAPSGPGAPMPGAASPAPPGAAAPGRLGEPQVINALEAQGFTEVHTVKRSGYILQMQAKKDGKPVMLVVNTVTGQAREYPQH